MRAVRFAFPISYVFFVVLLAGTIVFFDSLELTEGWVLALVAPALLTALVTFVGLPLYEWLRLPPDEKSRIKPRHISYHVVQALVMLFAPIALARPVLDVTEVVSVTVLIVTVLLLVVNTGMLLFAGYFVDEGNVS